jgi:Domain of unknown function (DUF6471)
MFDYADPILLRVMGRRLNRGSAPVIAATGLYRGLSERLKEHGFEEAKASVANKLARATVPAAFFLATLAAIGCQNVPIKDL